MFTQVSVVSSQLIQGRNNEECTDIKPKIMLIIIKNNNTHESNLEPGSQLYSIQNKLR